MRRYLLILMGLTLILLYGNSQPPISTKSKRAAEYYTNAIEQLSLLYYDKAIYYLKNAINIDSQFIDAYLLLGQVYADKFEDSLAIDNYTKGVQINPDYYPPVYSELAFLEYNNGIYSNALEHIKKYLSYPTQNNKFREAAELLLKKCEFAINAVKRPVPFNPQNLGPNINNEMDQYWPSLSADEQTLVFTGALILNPNKSKAIANIQEDFYISTFENEEWSVAKPLGPPLNTSQNEGAQSISADGRIMVFTGCNRREGIGKCDLYISHQNDGKWSTPKNMEKPVNSVASDRQPSVSADGRKIFFSSNREGSKGGYDIWMTQLSDSGTWEVPINLGDSINTKYDEQSPFIHPDNTTLYFSSNGWPGLGRSDLYVTREKNDTLWSTPMNLGYPINTHYAEEGLIVNAKGNRAYYSSNRGGYGGIDIFSFDLYPEIQPVKVSYMKGRVFDAESHIPLKARFELIDLNSSSIIMDSYSDNNGFFLICIPSGKDYALNVNRKGYLFYSDNFTLSHGDYLQPFQKDVPLEPIKIGGKVILKNIFFEHNSYTINPVSKVELQRLIQLLNEYASLKIEISGHTDNTGSAEYNQKLSESRAQSVTNYIIEKGIDPKRLLWKGYGEKQPVVKNDCEENRALNRRTEFRVIGL